MFLGDLQLARFGSEILNYSHKNSETDHDNIYVGNNYYIKLVTRQFVQEDSNGALYCLS